MNITVCRLKSDDVYKLQSIIKEDIAKNKTQIQRKRKRIVYFLKLFAYTSFQKKLYPNTVPVQESVNQTLCIA